MQPRLFLVLPPNLPLLTVHGQCNIFWDHNQKSTCWLHLRLALNQKEHLKSSLRRARKYLMEALPVLHAKRLAQNLHQMAIRDTLTGLYNRRFLEGNINTILAGIQRRESNLAILMADMDFFKKVNDEYGHESGDQVLKSLSHILQNSVRATDLVIRYGGEEFLILLVDCSPDDFAMQIAEKIRTKVEDFQFRIEGR